MEAISSRNIKNAQTHLIFLVSVCALFVAYATPAITHADIVDTFIANIEVHEDSSFTAVEQFTYAFSSEQKKVVRCFSRTNTESSKSLIRERYIDLTVTHVRMDARDIPHTIEETRNNVCITFEGGVGGAHAFEIEYTVQGAVVYQEYGGAELVWNVLGYDWSVPLKSVSVSVASFDTTNTSERACFRGLGNESNSCGLVSAKDGVTTFQGRQLAPHEGMIITQGLNRSKIKHVEHERFTITAYTIFGGIAFCLSVLWGAYQLYLARMPKFSALEEKETENVEM